MRRTISIALSFCIVVTQLPLGAFSANAAESNMMITSDALNQVPAQSAEDINAAHDQAQAQVDMMNALLSMESPAQTDPVSVEQSAQAYPEFPNETLQKVSSDGKIGVYIRTTSRIVCSRTSCGQFIDDAFLVIRDFENQGDPIAEVDIIGLPTISVEDVRLTPDGQRIGVHISHRDGDNYLIFDRDGNKIFDLVDALGESVRIVEQVNLNFPNGFFIIIEGDQDPEGGYRSVGVNIKTGFLKNIAHFVILEGSAWAVREDRFDELGRLVKTLIFKPLTPLFLERIIHYDPATSQVISIDEFIDPFKLVKTTHFNPSTGDITHVISFNPDTGVRTRVDYFQPSTGLSYGFEEFDHAGRRIRRTVLNPDTQRVVSVEHFEGDTGVLREKEEFDFNGRRTKHTLYDTATGHATRITLYHLDTGNRKSISYFRPDNGRRYGVEDFDSQGRRLRKTVYDPWTGHATSITWYNVLTGLTTSISYYRADNGLRYALVEYNSKGQRFRAIVFDPYTGRVVNIIYY